MSTSTNSRRGKVLPYNLKSVPVIREDIRSWNLAQTMAQMEIDPQNWRLQQLFTNIAKNATLTSQINIRKEQVFSSAFNLLKPNGEIDEEQTKLLRKHPAFRTITHGILDSIYYGYTIMELSFGTDGHGKNVLVPSIVPRTNVVPRTGTFYRDYTNLETAVQYRDLAEYGTWILEFDSGDIGLLNKAVPYCLFQRFAESCWSELLEKFGINPRVLKTNTRDKDMLDRAEAMMREWSSAVYMIIDESEDVNFGEASTTNGDAYDKFTRRCDNMICNLISGAIIGQDTEHGNYSKETANQEIQWLLVQSDMKLLETHWTNTVLPAMARLGVIKPGLTFEYEEAEDTEQLFRFTTGLISTGRYRANPKWLLDKFGVEVEEVQPSQPNPEPDPEPDREGKPTRGRSKKNEGATAVFQEAPALAVTGAECCNGNHPTAVLPGKAFDDDALIQRVWDGGGKLTFDYGLFLHTADLLTNGFKKGWKDGDNEPKAISFTYGEDDPAALTAYETNLFRFSAGKTLAEVQELNRLFRDSKSFDEFYRRAKEVTDVFNKAWLETEYNTSLLVGTSAAAFQRLTQNAKTFPYWEYLTVGDSAVRPEHAALHGLILPYNDPQWKKLFPPNGWGCRCRIVAKMRHEVEGVDIAAMRVRADEYMESTEFKKSAAQGWGVNRADTGEVFTANQMYIAKFPGAASKKLNALGPSDFGLPSYSNAKKVATSETPVYEGTANDFLKEQEDMGGKKVVRDYNNRPIQIEPKAWRLHTTGRRVDRVPYLDAMKETLSGPDEVWIKGEKLEDMAYIKYYTDGAFVSVTDITGRSTLSTWFPLAEVAEAIRRWRKGLNIMAKTKPAKK